MIFQNGNQDQLKYIINAILENKRILVYRNEITGEIDDKYTLFYNDSDSDYDILSIPYVISKLGEEKQFIRFLYESEKFDIDGLSKLIVDYLDYKEKNCFVKGNVYAELLGLLALFNYNFSTDYTLFNKNTYSGKIRYVVTLNPEKYVSIVQKIEYCNYCFQNKNQNLGIQKCLTYKLE